jgi:hypothetical protein
MVDSELLFDKNLRIYNEANQFVIHKNREKSFISFDKSSHTVKRIDYSPKLGTGIEAFAIVGLLEAKTYSYLLAVTRASYIGDILHSRIFKIEELAYISKMGHEDNNIIHAEDEKYIAMVKTFLSRNSLYFSDTLDLTLNFGDTFKKERRTKSNITIFIK